MSNFIKKEHAKRGELFLSSEEETVYLIRHWTDDKQNDSLKFIWLKYLSYCLINRILIHVKLKILYIWWLNVNR